MRVTEVSDDVWNTGYSLRFKVSEFFCSACYHCIKTNCNRINHTLFMSRSPAWCQLNPQVIRDKLVTETWVQEISTSHAGWSMCDHVPDVTLANGSTPQLSASFDHICFSLTTFGHFFGLLGVGMPLIISHLVIRKAYLLGRPVTRTR